MSSLARTRKQAKMSPRCIQERKKMLVVLTREVKKYSYRQIAKKCGISKSSVHRFCRAKNIILNPNNKELPKRRGRKRKISERNMRSLERAIKRLRKDNVNFTALDVVHEAGLKGDEVHIRTYRRYLNSMGYKFLVCRKKGLLSENDKLIRLRYARQMNSILKDNADYYTNHISFYLDGVSFIHKYNPYKESLSPRGRVWRKAGEGLKITAKGSKDLAGGRRIHFIVAIAHNKGMILVEEYDHMNGEYFAKFLRSKLNFTFAKAGPKFDGKRIFCMDNDPSQNSQVALNEISKREASLHTIPARSPDLNPIENIFHTVKKNLHNDAISKQLKHESINMFRARVKQTLYNVSSLEIDKVIESMPTRIQCIINGKGNRTKY